MNKMFNIVQSCRADASIMRGSKENYKIDSDLNKVAEVFAYDLKQTSLDNGKHTIE